ncbi:DUF6444 domain-containing protein [Vibrio cincinnatiensis]|uniref:DUF6444 domain-containing protein n=1 Tax=Vibrio cincinnatiensis TaxID=675 RepID=UPI003B97AB4F
MSCGSSSGTMKISLPLAPKNSSKSPSSDSPKDRHERKKMKALVVAIREELKKATQGINENFPR